MKKGVEISYLEIAGATALALSYHMIKGESLPEFGFTLATTGGTLLFSKAAYQAARSLRELVVGTETPAPSLSHTNRLR